MKTLSLSNITAGLVAVIVGVTSTIALIFQAATAGGATSAEISSWILALGVGMGITSMGFSLYYRMPILTAWSTTGAAFLISALPQVSLAEATGAFIFSALLMLLSGVTGFFEKIITRIPKSLAAAMLAGILFNFGLSIFKSMESQFLLVFIMFITYLMGKQLFPRFVIFLTLSIGIVMSHLMGLFQVENLHIALSSPVFTMPVFTFSSFISIGIPLFLLTMISQNIPGIAIIKASGYQPPISPIVSWIGVVNFLLAPFGAFALNLAAITAAICLSEEADRDSTKRYKAAIYGGIFYLLLGLFGATVVVLFSAFPKELILAIAGLALLSTIGNSLKMALDDDGSREPALITLLVSASGITLFGIGSAFWGLVAGILSLMLLTSYKEVYFSVIKKLLSIKKRVSVG